MDENRTPNWDDDGPTPFDVDDKFREWIRALDEDVIQGDYGYERGEFTVYAEHWHDYYLEGLTPAESFKRALDAYAESRREREEQRRAESERIKAADAKYLSRAPGTGGSREGSMPNPDEKDISAAPQTPSVSSEIERLRAELEKADEAMRLIIQQAMTVEQAENVARDFLCWRRKSASPVPQNGEGEE
jgi:replicative superfamily II helicase